MKSSKDRRANIHFNEAQYKRISNDAKMYGETVPGVLKNAYFERLPPEPKLSADDAIQI